MSSTRRRRLALGVLIVFAVAAVVAVVWAWRLNAGLNDINRFELDRPTASQGPPRPADAADPDDTTVLLAGVDNGNRKDLETMLSSGDWQPGAFRSDAIMVLHIPADQSDAHLVSIPRDSWVPVEGYGEQKINAAFSYGGPSLLAQTVEQVIDARIDHVMVVDWDGFQGITRTLGGVSVAGRDLGPDEALRYVRERMSLPRGDFDRVERQRAFMLGILKGVRSGEVLANPVKLTRLVGDLADFVSVDSGLTNRRLVALGWSGRSVAIASSTAPHQGTATVDGQSIVRLDIPATRQVFDRIIPSD